MSKSNATSSARGWEFQINAAIYLFFRDIKNIKKLNVEGSTEDIELIYNDGKNSYFQAKSTMTPNTNNLNWSKNLKNSIKTLNFAFQNKDIKKLGIVLNYPDAFGKHSETISRNDYQAYSYSQLTEEEQEIVFKYIPEKIKVDDENEIEIEKEKFSNCLEFIFIPFLGTDSETRHRFIKKKVSEFLGSINLDLGSNTKDFLAFMQSESLRNAANGGDDALKKEDIIWPLIAIVVDNSKVYLEIEELFDPEESEIEDILENYSGFMKQKINQFNYMNRVLFDYSEYNRSYVGPRKQIIRQFVIDSATDYRQGDFSNIVNDKLAIDLVKLINYSILKKHRQIQDIELAAGICE